MQDETQTPGAEAAAQKPNNAPNPWVGTPTPGTVELGLEPEPGGAVLDAPTAEWNPWDKAAGPVAEAAEAAVIEKGEALEDVAESIPFVGDDLGDAVGEGTDVAQDVVDGCLLIG
jgi:hypothetical protein